MNKGATVVKPILFFGEAFFDKFYDERGVCTASLPGGSVLNAAVGAARLGLPAEFSGGFGGDNGGIELLRLIEHEGIGMRHVFVKKDKLTCAAEVRLDAAGVPSFKFLRAGRADESVTREDVAGINPSDFSALHCAGILLTSEPAASAQEFLAEKFLIRGVPVSFDLNVRPALIQNAQLYRERAMKFMLRAALLKFSAEDIEWLLPGQDAYDSFAAVCGLREGALTVLTAGAGGSIIRSGQVCERFLTYSVDVKDTTGCGDGYAAGLLRGLFTLPHFAKWNALTSEQVHRLGSGASAVAARVGEKQGAIAAMPRLEELEGENGTSQ